MWNAELYILCDHSGRNRAHVSKWRFSLFSRILFFEPLKLSRNHAEVQKLKIEVLVSQKREAASTFVRKREMNAKTHAKCIMWMNSIHLCGVCLANRRMLSEIRSQSYWCGCTLIRAANESPAERMLVRLCGKFWTSNFLAFVRIRLGHACLVREQMWTHLKVYFEEKKYKILRKKCSKHLFLELFNFDAGASSALSSFLRILGYDSSVFEIPKLKIVFWKMTFKFKWTSNHFINHEKHDWKKSMHQTIIQLYSHKTTQKLCSRFFMVTVRCYRQIVHIAVTLCIAPSNFIMNSTCYTMVLCYSVTLHVCIYLNSCHEENISKH